MNYAFRFIYYASAFLSSKTMANSSEDCIYTSVMNTYCVNKRGFQNYTKDFIIWRSIKLKFHCVAFWLSSYVNIKTVTTFADWLAPKKGALFSLIYFFGSFCIYCIPHNYVIPQTMPHAIPQAHSAFYPHRTK